ncbi:L-aspartate oxidase [Bacillaceae bacterium IKA-2]|nr:L-aspartate oxidase [Bacillaceae bacterium IKA-2]
MEVKKTDVVIIGSGLAGLMTADYLCDSKNVLLVTKSEINQSNSWLAQGGIAAAVTKEDHWQDHYHDTIVAGSFHNRKETTEILVKEGASLVSRLIDIGVSFDKTADNELSLGMEGAHRRRRILHAGGDATGKALVGAVLTKVLPKIEVIEKQMAFDFFVDNGICRGIYTKDEKENICFIEAEHVILATGGVGQLYSVTSNCKEATGDGIAMAYRAGAAIADMEFIQFHPTMLNTGDKSCGLISEAVRGEGGKLVTEDGAFLMKGKHQLEDLAPRDVVAREIFYEKLKNKNIFLNISKVNNFQERFPSIYKMCQLNPGIIETGLIPVQPGAHFIMGGIKVDDDGQTTIKNLYAVGECAYTGVHGANRLASNSLLEAVVFAERLSKLILNKKDINNTEKQKMSLPVVNYEQVILPTIEEIQAVMDQYVGIFRNALGLQKAVNWFQQFESISIRRSHLHLTSKQKAIINMITVGLLITKASLNRNESRGGHYRSDYPAINEGKWFGYRNVFLQGNLYREKFLIDEIVVAKVRKELSIT